ncbi:MAG TPA: GNAT family N-acetyltransferase [Anaerolineae bacterium]|nr:GNAT family N-acetyltransferase [Anaerolineae bacterium]
MDLQELNELNEKRRLIRPLLSSGDPADALASYYTLWHDPRRTRLTLHRDAGGKVDGFLVVAQTGADLFRPLVTLRAPGPEVVGTLVGEALAPHRPYQVIVPVRLASAVRDHLHVEKSALTRLYLLDPSRFQPIINVLVQRVASAEGAPRFQIESQGQVMAMAGINWRSPAFAEIFVYVHPSGRGRGWGRSVVSACTNALLEERVRPLYAVDEDNEASQRIAEALGYADTGLRDMVAEGQLPEAG